LSTTWPRRRLPAWLARATRNGTHPVRADAGWRRRNRSWRRRNSLAVAQAPADNPPQLDTSPSCGTTRSGRCPGTWEQRSTRTSPTTPSSSTASASSSASSVTAPFSPKPRSAEPVRRRTDRSSGASCDAAPERYVRSGLSGSVTFDYSNISGRYTLGADPHDFTLRVSKAGHGSVYVYNDPADIRTVALKPHAVEVHEIGDGLDHDASSRTRMARVGSPTGGRPGGARRNLKRRRLIRDLGSDHRGTIWDDDHSQLRGMWFSLGKSLGKSR
jgi:hypothetical protein